MFSHDKCPKNNNYRDGGIDKSSCDKTACDKTQEDDLVDVGDKNAFMTSCHINRNK